MAVKKRKVKKGSYRKAKAGSIGAGGRGAYGAQTRSSSSRGGKRAKAPIRRRKP